jgi:hypothetical protein
MDSPEDFEFVVQTLAGSRDVVISRTALSKLGGSGNTTPEDIILRYQERLRAVVERKLGKGRSADSGQIRLHATDF